ncbi:MAG: SRPBCC domain-containing protein [Acidimicrobiia bacterium]
MEPVVLTRDVILDVPVDDLWQLVADPDGLTAWLGDAVELDVRPGGVGIVRDGGGGDDGSAVRHVRVDRVEPRRDLAFTWWPADDRDTASQVVFELTDVPGGGSRLHITETLLGPVPPANAAVLASAAQTAWEVRVLSLWACSVAAALV